MIDNNKSFISQNNKENFTIKKSENGNYAIDILFNPYTYINTKNLYYIIMGYLKNNKFLCISICICGTKKDRSYVMENIRPSDLIKFNINKFEEWLYYRIFNDKKYDPEKLDTYCIRLIFSKKFIDIYNVTNNCDILEKLVPIPPLKYKKKNKINHIFQKFPFLKRTIRRMLNRNNTHTSRAG